MELLFTALNYKEEVFMVTGLAASEEPGRYYTFQSRLPHGEFCLMVRSLLLMMKPVCVSATQYLRLQDCGRFMILKEIFFGLKRHH